MNGTHDLILVYYCDFTTGDLWSYNWQRDVFVVSPEPDVSAYKLDIRRHKCLILASDGLWNMVKPHEAIDVVQDIEHDLEDRASQFNLYETGKSISFHLCWESRFIVVSCTELLGFAFKKNLWT